jgi:hypothetical protein
MRPWEREDTDGGGTTMADQTRIFAAEPIHQRGARVGEPVWLLLNHVKADRRAQFERFVFEALRPAGERLAPAIPARVRVLAPTRANDDGTFTYIMLLDPVLPDEDYRLAPLLERAYGEEHAREHMRAFTDALATPRCATNSCSRPGRALGNRREGPGRGHRPAHDLRPLRGGGRWSPGPPPVAR